MRGARYLLPIMAALAATSFARAQQTYVIDPATGQPVPVVQQSYAQAPYAPQPYTQPQYAQPQYDAQAYQPPAVQPEPSGGNGLFSSQIFSRQSYAPQPQNTPQTDQQLDQPPAPESGRGLFNTQRSTQRSAPPVYALQPAQQTYAQQPAPQVYVQQPAYVQQPPPETYAQPSVPPVYAQQPSQQMYTPQPVQQPYVLQYMPPQRAAPQYSAPQYATPYSGGTYVAAPYGYASVSPYEQPYTLDAGDKLRVVVFGQDGISNSYIVDAGGNVNLPLIGSVPARGATTQQLSQMIAERLKQGYVREPHVSVEVEIYRPFFILGEVTNPGQYPYVADMSVEKAIAIAGGFSPRASKSNVELTRSAPGQSFKGNVPLTYPLRPGDTVVVKERWF